MTHEPEVHIRKFTRSTVYVTVRVTPDFRLRYWLGIRLMRAGAWVMGLGFEAEEAA